MSLKCLRKPLLSYFWLVLKFLCLWNQTAYDYHGGSIIVAIVRVVVVSAMFNFKQSRQFEKFSLKSGDIRVDVLRDG